MGSDHYDRHRRSPDRRLDRAHSPHRRRDERPASSKTHYGRREHSRSRSPFREQKRRELRRSPSVTRSPSRRVQPRDASSFTHRSSRNERSRSRSTKRRKRSRSSSRSPAPRSRMALPSQEQAYLGPGGEDGAVVKEEPKEKPNFKSTGLLAAETNKVVVGTGTTAQSIVLKYHEPPEARKPPSSAAWVLYIFKGASPDPLDTIPLHLRSCWLLGREAAVVDILVEHPSLSKQHAVFQFRYVVSKDQWGEKKGKVALYILDLESANGTWLNGKKIEAARYVECFTGDVLKLGLSEREYVVLLPPKDGIK